MLKKIKQLITVAAFGLLVLAPVAVPSVVSAQANIQDNLCAGAEFDPELNATDCEESTAGAGEDVDDFIADVVNILSLIIGSVAVIMIIIGGFKYITSNGNDSNVASAKNTIMYAIIGLVIVALAQFIVRFVLSRITD